MRKSMSGSFLAFFVSTVVLILLLDGCSDRSPLEDKNTAPRITSASLVEAAADIPFCYTAEVSDPDGPAPVVQFLDYPQWLTAEHDSLTGTPPVGAVDTSFTVVASDGDLADTLAVTIQVNPTLVVYGDTRTGHTAHQQVVDQIRAVKPATVFHVGDLVNNGLDQSDWDTFNIITADMRAESEFFPALGNHEYQSPLYFNIFELPGNEQWYSVTRSYIHFIILNTCVDISPGSDQYQWLASELASIADTVRFVAAVFHHPPYSTGVHAEDELGLREKIVPLFEQHGVDIVFTGHDHDYERSFCGGIYYIVTGGGGAPLRAQARSHPCSQLFLQEYHFCRLSIVGDSLRVRVCDQASVPLDDFSLSRSVSP
ncbi:MAG: metallophosphoesterase [Candidatus Zixiibacteriota bacterium]|nr:MAG: metallophosphoesterase [candidate division Zixibacteria bacterium]